MHKKKKKYYHASSWITLEIKKQYYQNLAFFNQSNLIGTKIISHHLDSKEQEATLGTNMVEPA